MFRKLVFLLCCISVHAARRGKKRDLQLASDAEFRSTLGITNLDVPTFFDATQHLDVILAYIQQKADTARTSVLVDAFGGIGNLQKTFAGVGYIASSFDAARGSEENILTRRGFFHALDLVLALMVGGLLFGGPPCSLSSFSYVSLCTNVPDAMSEEMRATSLCVLQT